MRIRSFVAFLSVVLVCFNGWAQEVNFEDSVSRYHQLSGAGEDVEAAKLAYNIAEYYLQVDSLSYSKKFFNYSRNNAAKAKQKILEARSTYKQGYLEKRMAESGKYSLEEEQEYYRAAIKTLGRAHNMFKKAKMGGSYEDALTSLYAGESLFTVGEYDKAVSALKVALRDAQKNRYDDLSFKSSDLLAQSYAEMNDPDNEEHFRSINKNYQEFFKSKDSLVQTVEKVEMLVETTETQQSEIDLQKSEMENVNLKLENEIAKQEMQDAIIKRNALEKKVMIGGIGIILLLLLIAIISFTYTKRTNKKLAKQNKQILEQKSTIERRQKELKDEKARTDALLLNILPVPIANELKKEKKVAPRYYKMVSVMFTDFKGFTKIAEQMSPGEIVRELDSCFIAFDQIIEKYEQSVGRNCVEKIKTIGDGYMCAGGVPIVNETNPVDLVRVGLAFVDYMEKRKAEKEAKKEPFFEIRIGINTGPVVAGVVGKKKFAYDIWGDAVNLASRMESSGEVGRVNISEDTYEHVKDNFFFTKRGKIKAKNKGEVEMYFVDGRVKYNNEPKSSAATTG